MAAKYGKAEPASIKKVVMPINRMENILCVLGAGILFFLFAGTKKLAINKITPNTKMARLNILS